MLLCSRGVRAECGECLGKPLPFSSLSCKDLLAVISLPDKAIISNISTTHWPFQINTLMLCSLQRKHIFLCMGMWSLYRAPIHPGSLCQGQGQLSPFHFLSFFIHSIWYRPLTVSGSEEVFPEQSSCIYFFSPLISCLVSLNICLVA